MNLKLSGPSKTFLAGEYGVLAGGPGLILNTAPRFELRASKGTGQVYGIPVGAPAHRWLKENAAICANWDLEFHDPHLGAGGFGASGAQFLFAHRFTTFVQAPDKRTLSEPELKSILADFRRLGEGSGSDILSQAVGLMARVENDTSESLLWPFPELDFAILRTNQKIATHKHLREFDKAQCERFPPLVRNVCAAIALRDALKFVRAINEYGEALVSAELQAKFTCTQIAAARAQDWCLAAKGCGAYGADTLLLLFRSENLPFVRDFAAAQGLPFIASRADLSAGLKLDWSS